MLFLGALALLALLALAAIGYVLYGPSLDRAATQEAAAFCNAFPVGESQSAVLARAEQRSIRIVRTDRDGSVQLVAWFPGFFANAAACTVVARGGTVESKYVKFESW